MSAPRSLAYLSAVPVERVKGIGPKRAARLAEAGVASVADLLLHVPRRYIDRSRRYELATAPLGEEITVWGRVESVVRRRISRNRTMITARISDGTTTLEAVWFWPRLRIEEGWDVALSGKLERRRGKLRMTSPDLDPIGEDAVKTGRIVPVHAKVAGLGPYLLRAAIANALKRSRPIADPIPGDVLAAVGLVDRDRAFAQVHFPDTAEDASRARRRLAFDEFFRLELALALRRRHRRREAKGIAHRSRRRLVDRYLGSLPYELTGAQRRALAEIDADLRAPRPMHRLLQGEVGSGKTVVAVSAMLRVVEGGSQAAVMAPTEVLATQHYLGLVSALEAAGLAPEVGPARHGTPSLFEDAEGDTVGVALLTSTNVETNLPGLTARDDVLAAIAGGHVDVVVGTHALIQEGVAFTRLGLAVVDEQHRFGVHQRVRLKEKAEGHEPDLLIMTATPIPRTLAMTLYGDLDVGVIDEMPPGRSPVETVHLTDPATIVEELRRTVAEGRQAFVVCPLVDDSDQLEAASAVGEWKRLSALLPELRIGLLHGQLAPGEKAGTMARFRAGELDVLVATTVVEVGIDVPNATLMVVEDADRFGLSQLHQLRGRVGRGRHRGRCVLVANPTTPEGARRIAAMVATSDGFRLAEEDLRIRGQGTVFGARQAGMTDLRLADILRDADLLAEARRHAFALVDADPELAEHPDLAEELRLLIGEDVEWLEKS